MRKAQEFYERKIKSGEKTLGELEKKCLIFSVSRFSIVLIAGITMYYFYNLGKYEYLTTCFIAGVIVFMIIAYFHNIKLQQKKKLEISIKVNKDGISRISGEWRTFKDKGEEFLKDNHGYINDLDVFGDGSLFQWINSTKTKFGRKALANMLMNNSGVDKKSIMDRQNAVKELANKVDWRQKLQIESTFKSGGKNNIEDLLNWAEGKSINTKFIIIVAYLFIIFTGASLFLVTAGIIPVSYLILVFMLNYVVVKLLTRKLGDVVYLFQKHKEDIEAYRNILNLIVDEKFESSLLNNLKIRLNGNKENSCKVKMKALKNLIDWIGDSSANPYYLLFNVTVLSDVFILSNLEKWRSENGKYLKIWLETMGEFEALSSISNIAFDFDEWQYPILLEGNEVKGKNIGHPMLGDKAKRNDFSLTREEKIALVTGSNMSGKSTFLRTIGLNLILSYMGCPTYSDEFSCGIFNIYTCMRTKDNLEENISSFYAEILRIKYLIEASKSGEKVFFLLDEIFKGTNSKDRHQGAKVLINQLVNAGGVGLVSTHDLELCDLEKENIWLINYNFQEYYEEGKIKFDYKLRHGKSTTTNAVHLMKLAGIDFK